MATAANEVGGAARPISTTAHSHTLPTHFAALCPPTYEVAPAEPHAAQHFGLYINASLPGSILTALMKIQSKGRHSARAAAFIAHPVAQA